MALVWNVDRRTHERQPKGIRNLPETVEGNTVVMAATIGEPGLRPPLTGYRVGVVAHRGRQEQAEVLRGLGAGVVLGATVDAVSVAGNEALEAKTEETITGVPAAVVFTSAAGVEGWLATAEELGRDQALREVLVNSRVLIQGPATGAAAVALGVAIDDVLPDDIDEAGPLLEALASKVAGRPVMVQFEGETPSPLVEALRGAGVTVSEVVVPVAGLPADREPAQRLVLDLVEGRVEALTLTSPEEVRNLVALAEDAGQSEGLLTALNEEVIVVCVSRACHHASASVGLDEVVRPERARVGAMVDALVSQLEKKTCCFDLAGVEVALHGTLAVIDGKEVWLAERERALLAMLARRPGTVVSKAELLRRVWRSDGADTHAVEVAVGRLRRRLGPAAGAALQTVPRRGYRLAAS